MVDAVDVLMLEDEYKARLEEIRGLISEMEARLESLKKSSDRLLRQLKEDYFIIDYEQEKSNQIN